MFFFNCKACDANNLPDVTLHFVEVYHSGGAYEDSYWTHQGGYCVVCPLCRVRNRWLSDRYSRNIPYSEQKQYEERCHKLIVEMCKLNNTPTEYTHEDKLPLHFVNWTFSIEMLQEIVADLRQNQIEQALSDDFL